VWICPDLMICVHCIQYTSRAAQLYKTMLEKESHKLSVAAAMAAASGWVRSFRLGSFYAGVLSFQAYTCLIVEPRRLPAPMSCLTSTM
jgi:hypothetical protein